jgi:flagellar M-ring protein FliF
VVVKTLWATLSRGARIGLVTGALSIVGMTIALAVWALRTDYEVLFSDLSPKDASAMTGELDRMHLPYRIGADGSSILVDRRAVHETRLKLMGKEIPLQGAVGFELFNASDFGMTEFAQKVNYQRALQGELTRTIQAIAEVETARVHVALTEEGLFKRNQAKAKASITLAMKHGKTLRREQVAGIQRLVAAAVPGIQRDDVTIVNEQGVALTQAQAEGDAGAAPTSLRLELKQEVELRLAAKANTVLEKTFGTGQALASVDVTLDMNQVRVTTEDVTTPTPAAGEAPAGIVVRERETVRDAGAPRTGADGTDAVPADMHRETDYQVGRRVEQVVSSPGAISRLHALAILKAPLNAGQIEQVKALLASAVGASRERGDTIVVQPIGGLVVAIPGPEAPAVQPAEVATAGPPIAPAAMREVGADFTPTLTPSVAAAAILLIVVAALAVARRRSRRRTMPTAVVPVPMSLAERETHLLQIQAWLGDAPEAAESRVTR